MRELSIEEKAKRYDEAKARMSRAYNSNRCTIGFMNEIFSELKEENEDERIIKHLITLFKDEYGENSNARFAGIKVKDIIAWLEKQGEQKPTDKVEPKFKINDFIVNNNSGCVSQVTEIRDDEYCIWPLYSKEEAYLRFIYIDNDYHLWTIQDAKDGDVLYMDNGLSTCTFIYKSINNVVIQKYASYNKFGFEGTTYLVLNDGYVCPATKEQRDLLFQKMHETGYEWDAEKKELKKIEQKHTPKHKVGDTIYYNSFGDVKSMIVANVTTDSTDNPMYEDENGNIVFEEDLIEYNTARSEESSAFKDKLLELFQRFRWYCKDKNQTNGDIIDYVNAHIQELIDTVQNKSWSNEDERNLNDAILFIETGTYSLDKNNLINWLKSLKDRVLPQPKQEWSVDDERTYRSVLYGFERHFPLNYVQQEFVKSHIQPQNTWKPSKEQMIAIDTAINVLGKGTLNGKQLIELQEQLKKLKG